jgi:hypothetical protein
MAQHADAPTINRLAERIFGAQIVRKPVSPLGYATINDQEGRPIATVAVVLGRGNPEMLEQLLEQLKDELHPVDHDIMPPPEGPEGLDPDGGATQEGGNHA